MRKLLFSNGSPFARKIRILLAEKGLEYVEDVYDLLRPVEDIKPHNPALQIPVLYDGNHHLFGSQVIAEYLMTEYADVTRHENMHSLATSVTRADSHWGDLLVLTTTNELATSVTSFVLYSSDGKDIPFMGRQRIRIESCMDWLEERITDDGFWPGTFSLQDISLICPLLFAEKRKIFEFRCGHWPKIERLIDRSQLRPSVASTPVNETPK